MTTADQIGTWLVPQAQFAIEYSLATLNRINHAAVDALLAIRGGLGIGGVLLGTRDSKGIKILAFRKIECEYAFGPVFALSAHDLLNLTGQLQQIRQESGLREMEVVGWYVSHTRRAGRMLAESDLELYRTFFPEPWQVTLVLQPSYMAPTVAGFFFREADGSIRSSSTYREFSLGTWQGGAESTEPAPKARPEHQKIPAIEVRIKPPVLETNEEKGSVSLRPMGRPSAADPSPEPPAEIPEPVRPSASVLPESATAPPLPDPAPVAEIPAPPEPTALSVPPTAAISAVQAALPEPGKRRSSRPIWLWLAGVVLVAAAAGWSVMHWLPLRGFAPTALHLRATERDGLLEIRWDSSALPAQRVQSGSVTITDGTATESFALDTPQVMSGSVLYPRHSNSVDIHMAVKLIGGAVTEGYLTFAAAAEPTAALPAGGDSQEQKDLATEAERAQEELNKAQARNQQLEKALKVVQDAQPGAIATPPNRVTPGRGGPAPAVPQAPPAARPVPTTVNAVAVGKPPQPSASGKAPGIVSNPPAGVVRSPAPDPDRLAPSTGPAAAAAPQVPRTQGPAPVAAQTAALQATRTATPEDVLKLAQPREKSAPAPLPPAVQHPLPPAPPSLAGSWSYSEAVPSGSPFPPKAATLTIVQGNDQLTGTFTGQYRVPKGRRFKPDVQLRFAGPVHAGAQKFNYTASDGSTGEIEILPVAGKLNEVEVVWHSARDGLTFDDVLFRPH